MTLKLILQIAAAIISLFLGASTLKQGTEFAASGGGVEGVATLAMGGFTGLFAWAAGLFTTLPAWIKDRIGGGGGGDIIGSLTGLPREWLEAFNAALAWSQHRWELAYVKNAATQTFEASLLTLQTFAGVSPAVVAKCNELIKGFDELLSLIETETVKAAPVRLSAPRAVVLDIPPVPAGTPTIEEFME